MPDRVAAEDRWEVRAARARRLQREQPAAADALDFYARLAAVQGSLLRDHERAVVLRTGPSPPEELARCLDVGALRIAALTLLAWMRREAPPPVAEAAEALQRVPTEGWRQLIETHCSGGASLDVARDTSAPPKVALAPPIAASAPQGAAPPGAVPARPVAVSGAPGGAERESHLPLDESTTFLVEALLQPFAEAAAASGELAAAAAAGAAMRCPVCAGRPVVGVLREKGHGAERWFVCGLCLTPWPSLRLVCPACGEQRFDRLPVFRAEGIGAARIDACDTCRVYVKTIDLTEDGEAVPVVDDLASVALDLWARGEGYARLRPNLLRL